MLGGVLNRKNNRFKLSQLLTELLQTKKIARKNLSSEVVIPEDRLLINSKPTRFNYLEFYSTDCNQRDQTL